MAFHSLGAAALSDRFQCLNRPAPKTPEPSTAEVEEQCPPPNRPPRLRLKRRQASRLNAPTQQFLASIAAADVPIPSVEDEHLNDEETMTALLDYHMDGVGEESMKRYLTPRMFSPPRTPALEISTYTQSANYPDWYLDSPCSDSETESSPDCESSRPSTAFSTQTSSSLYSMFSQITDDEACVSQEGEMKSGSQSNIGTIHATSGTRKTRKAPWTRAMSAHLWATYLLYLSDPRVTPIRQGKSCIPPHGVCARVSRQAQRSWKGARMTTGTEEGDRGHTPTAEASKTYIQWPHTPAATRAHLRELCKLKFTRKTGHDISHSPAPFTKAANRRWNRRCTPARSASVFSAQEMAMSLAVSTSDSMQPHGPLAQLASSSADCKPVDEVEYSTKSSRDLEEAWPLSKPAEIPRNKQDIELRDTTQLGSPFLAKSYGPSSSTTIAAKLSLPKQSNTVGARKLLKSPVHLTSSRSGTQKRRSVKNNEEKSWKRPSLAAAFFREGSWNAEPSLSTPSHKEPISWLANPLVPKALTPGQPTSAFPSAIDVPESPSVRPPRSSRLGSPFSGASSSYSFPNRFSSATNFSLAALRRPFATVQQPSHANAEATPPLRSSLASRLAYLDQRLKDFRNRSGDRRRSQSPM